MGHYNSTYINDNWIYLDIIGACSSVDSLRGSEICPVELRHAIPDKVWHSNLAMAEPLHWLTGWKSFGHALLIALISSILAAYLQHSVARSSLVATFLALSKVGDETSMPGRLEELNKTYGTQSHGWKVADTKHVVVFVQKHIDQHRHIVSYHIIS